MPIFIQILVATLSISIIAAVGSVLLFMQRAQLQRILYALVSLSAGTLLGAAFFHLLPESLEDGPVESTLITVVVAFVSFYLIEKFVLWHHCHEADCEHDRKSLGHMNLLGDSIHNFLDGLIIAAAFIADPALGVVTTIAVASHELPQEIGDFGVLLHAGWKYQRALVANVLVALTVVAGGIVGFFLSEASEELAHMMMPFAAGAFLYVAASDLIPETRRHNRSHRSWIGLTIFFVGLLLMYLLAEAGHGH